jgi:hypothetical protein
MLHLGTELDPERRTPGPAENLVFKIDSKVFGCSFAPNAEMRASLFGLNLLVYRTLISLVNGHD